MTNVKGPHWRETIPEESGLYWAADRDGHLAGPFIVVYDLAGNLTWAGTTQGWAGWWWSEPIVEDPEHLPNDRSKTHV